MNPFHHPRILAAAAALMLAAPQSTLRAADAAPAEFDGATPLEWSVLMARSEIDRLGDKLAWAEQGGGKWSYTTALLTLSMLKLNEVVPDATWVEFSESGVGSFIAGDGTIRRYNRDDFNIDLINPGKTVLYLWNLTGEERYREAAEILRGQLEEHPRTSEGGFWHKQRYPFQMWLDGLYMGAPFYAEYAGLFGPENDFDDVVLQFRLMDRYGYDPDSGLYYHGWDESKEQEWADPVTGTSPNFWGRGLGWFAMALVDTLDFLPEDHPGRVELMVILNKVCAGIVRHQDPATGVWWQVLDQGGREGNYRESTASCMYTYAMAKAVNRGYISDAFEGSIIRAYRGIHEQFIRRDPNGGISLTDCCSVAGLGYGRDGSFEYYMSEPIVDNDHKGVGPFILAGIEVQKMLELPGSVRPEKVSLEAAEAVSSRVPEWAEVPEILARIVPPTFPDRDFVITDFGAETGWDASDAIREAIAACASAGGGRVVVPAGDYLTGPIRLLSKVNLHVEEGATLRFKTESEAYLPAVLTRFEGMELYNYSPLIYAFEQEDIAVTGGGVLDGQAADGIWWDMKLDNPDRPGRQVAARNRLMQQVADGVPVEERIYGEGDYLRPSFIQPYRCRNVLIEGVSIRRSPMWQVHPVLCTNVTVRGLDIVSHGPNNDGCNPESSKDVLIEDCLFDTGDDCIAIKSGRNDDGRRVGVPSENIVIRDCVVREGHGGVVMGSEISGGVRNVFVEDCVMDSPNLDRVLRFKSNAIRGGVIENVFMRRVHVGQVADAVLRINFLYEEGLDGPHAPTVRNVAMESVIVEETPKVLYVVGFPGATVENVRIYNSVFLNVREENVIRDASGVELVDCTVEPAADG